MLHLKETVFQKYPSKINQNLQSHQNAFYSDLFKETNYPKQKQNHKKKQPHSDIIQKVTISITSTATTEFYTLMKFFSNLKQ